MRGDRWEVALIESAPFRLERRAIADAGTIAGSLLAGDSEARQLFSGGWMAPANPDTALVEKHMAPARLGEDAFHATTPEAGERLRRVLGGEGVFVTTGQQPLLFLGPLYVLYKAATAIRMARSLEDHLGIPVLALFWVAGDDHDWNEVARTRVVERNGGVREFRAEPPPGWEGRSVGPAPWPSEALPLLEEFITASGATERSAEVLRGAYAPGCRFSEAFQRCLASVFSASDLILLDGASDSVRRAAVPLVRSVLERPEAMIASLAAGHEVVAQTGYRPTLEYLPGALPLFFDSGEARVRLYRAADALRFGREGPTQSTGWFLNEVETHPEAFGPNVALRPVLESWLVPTAATVLGPGEISYWAQLAPLFTEAGVEMPAVCPRDSWTVVEAHVERILDRAGVAPEELADGGRRAAERVVAMARPVGVVAAIERLEQDLDTGFDALERAVASELPGEKSGVGRARKEARKAIDGFRRKVGARTRQRERSLLEQLDRAAGNLYPMGRPQERIASSVPYLARYGQGLVRRLIESDPRRDDTRRDNPP